MKIIIKPQYFNRLATSILLFSGLLKSLCQPSCEILQFHSTATYFCYNIRNNLSYTAIVSLFTGKHRCKCHSAFRLQPATCIIIPVAIKFDNQPPHQIMQPYRKKSSYIVNIIDISTKSIPLYSTSSSPSIKSNRISITFFGRISLFFSVAAYHQQRASPEE